MSLNPDRPLASGRLAISAALCCLWSCAPNRVPPTSPDTATAAASEVHAEKVADATTASVEERSDGRAEYYDGAGVFVNAHDIVRDAGGADGTYEVAFVNTDVRTVVNAVLGQMLGMRYQVDPRVSGNISIESSSPVTKGMLLQLLETALRVTGYAMIESAGSYAIVPYSEAPKRVTDIDLPSPSSRSSPGFSVHIVPLRFVSAAQMHEVLQPFAPNGGIVRVDVQRNLLILAGTRQELEIMREAIRTFDVDWLKGMSFAMFKLNYVDAKTIADEILQIFGEIDSPIVGLVRLIPIPRLNAILAVSPRKSYLREVQVWIERLDLGGSTPGRRIFVYDVQNGDAGSLAESLNSILGQSSPALPADMEATAVQPNEVVNRIATSTNGSALDRDDVFSSGSLRIVPDEDNNSLLILATPNEFAVVQSALNRMDAPRRQVLIEASVAEVSLTDELRYGVQWFFERGDSSATLSETASGNPAPEFPGFSYVFTGSPDRTAILNALASITDVDVLSAPKLMVLNNQEATIQVGDQVPVAVQSAVNVTDPDAPIVNSVQFRDTGVILTVTPRINEGGLVLLDVSQELSAVTQTTTSGIDSPTIQQRKVATTVAVRDGETIALGGLIRESQTESKSGVPFLKDIPVLGVLFRSTILTERRTELIVLITPRVISDNHSLNQTMDYLREAFKNTRPFRIPEKEGGDATSKP